MMEDTNDSIIPENQKLSILEGEPAKHGNKVPFLEQLFLGMLLGFSIWQEDIERYGIYFTLLTETNGAVDCGNLLSVFSQFFLVSTTLWAVSSPLTGWVTDFFSPINLKLIFATSSFLQTFCFLAIFLRPWSWLGISPPADFAYWYMLVLFSIRQVAMNQSMTLNWKVIKLRVMAVLHRSGAYTLEEETAVINSVANFGDLISDISELIILGLFYFFYNWGHLVGIQAFPFQFGRMLIIGGCILGNLLTLAWTFTFCTKELEIPQRLDKIKDTIIHGEKSISILDEDAVDSLTSRENSVLGSNDPLLTSKPANIDSVSAPKKSKLREIADWLLLRGKWFWFSRVAFAAILMSLIQDFNYVLAEYPLSLYESSDMETIPESQQNPENYCGGLVASLMNQGAVVNLFFLCTTILYRIFFVKLQPKIFYRFAFPGMSLLLLALLGFLTLSPWDLPNIVVFILVSLIQIIPYYMETYNEAVWTAAAEPELFGFLYSAFFMSTYILDLVVGAIMLYAIPSNVIIVVMAIFVIGCVAYSIYISFKYEHDFPAELEG